MKFKENVGKTDQYVRYFLAFVFVLLSFISPWFVIGAILMLVTAYFRFCIIYRIFGFATCTVDEAKKDAENKDR